MNVLLDFCLKQLLAIIFLTLQLLFEESEQRTNLF